MKRRGGCGCTCMVCPRFGAPEPGPDPRRECTAERHALGLSRHFVMLSRAAALVITLSAVAGLAARSRSWSADPLFPAPLNSTSGGVLSRPERLVAGGEGGAGGEERCNVSVERLPAGLVARWDGELGARCDVMLYTTNTRGKALFSVAFARAASPVIIEHVGVAGARQEFRLCIGCGLARFRRSGSGSDSVHFCCLDFALDELQGALQGERGWRLNRKPVESTLVACFMTLVIIIWSVAALIWPVPIIAGFLPNGMEQRQRPR